MVGIVKLFGWLSIIVAVIVLCLVVISIPLAAILLPVGASALLGGALLIVFARIVELLEELNSKLDPVVSVARKLESVYQPGNNDSTAAISDSDLLNNPPVGAQVFKYKARRVVQLADGSVIGETLTGGGRRFASIKEFQNFID
jgi:hypothetical protein